MKTDRPPITALVPRLLAGEDEAISQLVDGVLGPLCAIAQRSGASRPDAEEVALDAIFKTLRLLPTLVFAEQPGEDPLFSYLAKAAKRGAQERFRKLRGEQLALARAVNGDSIQSIASLDADDNQSARSIWPSNQPEFQQLASETVQRVQEFLDSLSVTDRLIVELRSQTTLTWDEIAADVGLSNAAARKRWQRLYERLASRFDATDRKEGERD